MLRILCITLVFLSAAFGNTLSVCAIFQNEAPFMKEWIEYHILLGVEHFYLYNDRSTDNYQEILEPYILAGVVDLKDCSQMPGDTHFINQRRAYTRGLNAAIGRSQWVAFIDLDEFIVPKRCRDLSVMLEDYSDRLGVMINWRKFGTSGYWEIPQGRLLIETLTRCSLLDDEDNQISKSIIQIDKLPSAYFDEEFVCKNRVDLVHFHQWVKGKRVGPLANGCWSQYHMPIEEGQINHYWCRNEKYYLEKKVPRKAFLHHEDFNRPNTWPQDKIESYIHLYNLSQDCSILPFAVLLKKRL